MDPIARRGRAKNMELHKSHVVSKTVINVPDICGGSEVVDPTLTQDPILNQH